MTVLPHNSKLIDGKYYLGYWRYLAYDRVEHPIHCTIRIFRVDNYMNRDNINVTVYGVMTHNSEDISNGECSLWSLKYTSTEVVLFELTDDEFQGNIVSVAI